MATKIAMGPYSVHFSYNFFSKRIGLPNLGNLKVKNFDRWVVSSISHEELHRIVDAEMGIEASIKLDNLGYNIMTGCLK